MSKQTLALLSAGAALALSACGSPANKSGAAAPTPTAPANGTATDTAQASPAEIVPMITPVGSADGVNDGYPDLSPAPLLPEAERTAKGARSVLTAFARAIELKEFDQAWDMLDPAARQRMSETDFNKMFAGLDHITVTVPGGQMEGAAGSSFYTSQAHITASDADGRPVRIEGPITLRRVNDVPGATPYQLHWHIAKLDLAWTH